MTTKPPPVAADHIRALIKSEVEHLKIVRFVPVPNVGELPKWTKIHEVVTIQHHPLLDQLEAAVRQSKGDDGWLAGSPKSKPNARLDAIACLQRIERESLALAASLDIPPAPLRARLSTIAGRLGTDPNVTVRAWWIAARCLTGWEVAPYEPDVPCPETECERRGTLRIRLDVAVATCTKCGAVWDEHNYTQLGDYIRWASEHLRGAKHWTIDKDGYPVECTVCLVDRQLMAERQAVRIVAEKAAEDPPKARVAS